MRKKILKALSIIALLAIIFINKNKIIPPVIPDNTNEENYQESYEEEHEEESEEEIAYEREMAKQLFPSTPKFDPATLRGTALKTYVKKQKHLESTAYKFTEDSDFKAYMKKALSNTITQTPKSYTYANGALKGRWHQKHLNLYDTSGFRAIGSVYDPKNDEIYVVSSPGHLYKINEDANIMWSLRNHKKRLSAENLNGVNLSNGQFRLLHQKPNGGMELSDDEGRTWIDANGAFFENSWNFKTLVTKKASGKRIVAHGGAYNSSDKLGYHRIYMSSDYGLNYTLSNINHLKISEFQVKIVKPHNSRTVYCFARKYNDSKLFVYRMQESEANFKYMGQPITIDGLGSVKSTFVNGKTHFYISYGNKNIFYSSDEGKTWTQTSNKSSERNISDIHPTKPNICFRGFLQLFISFDYGATWTINKHYVGSNYYVWDLQHLKIYDKENGGFFTFAGFDFGAYYSSTPEVWSSWKTINRGNPTMMCYDAATSEKHQRIYTANQDRGSQSFLDNDNTDGTVSDALREASTDVLRVSISNDETSAWYWYYSGSIGKSNIVDGGNYKTVVRKDFYGNWNASSMIPSPIPNEDAVYIPLEKQLHIISHHNGKVNKTLHPYVFAEDTHSFEYSRLNPQRWYVGLQSGKFMYSNDGGKSFSYTNYKGSLPISEATSTKKRTVIKTSPIDEATVYYAGKGNLFLISKDGGKSFKNHNKGFNAGRIADMDISPDGQFIFAACNFGRAWVFSVAEDQWYKMDGSSIPSGISYTDVQYIISKKTVRFATYGSGIVDFIMENTKDPNIPDGNYTIKAEYSNKYMSVAGFKSSDGTTIEQWSLLNQENLQFNVTQDPLGYYKIKPVYNSKVFTAEASNKNGVGALVIKTDTGADNQRFQLTYLGNDEFRITPKSNSKKGLAVAGNGLKNGDNIVSFNFLNGNANFRWKFSSISQSKKPFDTTVTDTDPSSNLNVNIYPNPIADGVLNIKSKTNTPLQLKIFDIRGKVLLTRKLKKSENAIKLDKTLFKQGIYILKIFDKNKNANKYHKIMVN